MYEKHWRKVRLSNMTINEYQKEALRTEPTRQKSAQWGDWVEPHQWRMQLENGLMGLNGEAGEAIDLLKKHLFQGHPLDREHLAKELGDVAWYLAVSADALGYTLEEVLEMNVSKLRARYPEGFEVERSLSRKMGDV